MPETDTVTTLRDLMLVKLGAFIDQRPGLDPANYFTGRDWTEERRNYDRERGRILRDKRQADQLLRAVSLRSSITANDILFASHNRRLTWNGDRMSWNYCTGQYFPTEYRAAACGLLAECLWTARIRDCGEKIISREIGDKLRKELRREFGRAIAWRWFN